MINRSEFNLRMDNLRRMVRQNGLDAYVVSNAENIYYLTGISYMQQERPFFIVVRPDEPVVLLTPALEGEHLGAAPNIDQVVWYFDYPAPPEQSWPQLLVEVLDSARDIGVEPSLPLEIDQALDEHNRSILPLVEQLRMVKSRAELEMIRATARFCDMGARKILDASYLGACELEIVSQMRPVQTAIMKQVGYDLLASSLAMAVWPAPLSAQPHGVPTLSHRLGGGPHILLSYLRVNGYAAENERTYFVQTPDTRVREAFSAMIEARRLAAAKVRPGVPAAAVDLAAKEFLRAEGYGEYLLHRTGHGIGLGNHEGPWVAEGSQDILAENMVISIEPGIYLPEVGGVRHSDTVLVTRDGCRFLTDFPTELRSLIITRSKPLRRLKGKLMRRMTGTA